MYVWLLAVKMATEVRGAASCAGCECDGKPQRGEPPAMCVCGTVREKWPWNVTNVCRLMRAVKNCDETHVQRGRTALTGGGGACRGGFCRALCTSSIRRPRLADIVSFPVENCASRRLCCLAQLCCNGSEIHDAFLYQGILGRAWVTWHWRCGLRWIRQFQRQCVNCWR